MAIFTAVVVAGAIVAGLLVLGSPIEEREQQLDARRVGDLRMLASMLTARWNQTQQLPAGTAELVDGRSMSRLPVDPSAKTPYDYRVTGQRQFELCAAFSRASPPHESGDFWVHEAAPKCFAFDVDAKQPGSQ
jgi:hypothetical protein